MKQVLVVKQIGIEGPGRLGAFFESRGLALNIWEAHQGGPPPADLPAETPLVILGGPMAVYDSESSPFLGEETKLIRKASRSGASILGVCLGAQLIASAFGARVFSGGIKEIGWYTMKLTTEGWSDPLFHGFPGEFPVFHWHGDTFTVPQGGCNLVQSRSFENQCIKVDRRVYGTQFHLEVTREMIREWLEEYRDELFAWGGGAAHDKILADTERYWKDFVNLGDIFFRNLMESWIGSGG